MATPTSNTVTTSSIALSAIYYIDALLIGDKWGALVGTSVSLTYSFPVTGATNWSQDTISGYGPSNGTGEPWNNYSDLSLNEQAAAIAALSAWAAVANITFTQVADDANTVGEIRFGWSSLGPDCQAWAYTPDATVQAGDVWLNNDVPWDGYTAGTFGYLTLLHETGHALGLKHSFEIGGASDIVLPSVEDGYACTIMSYSALPGSSLSSVNYNPTTPMPYDIAAMQYLYGANNSYHSGNDTYTFMQGQSYHQTIWDGGGTDTIVWNASSEAATIDLRGGYWSDLGNQLSFSDQNGLTIAYDDLTVAIYDTVVIENATGGNANDNLIGNDAANILNGRGGADIMSGGLGNDTYVVNATGDIVTELAGQGTDRIQTSISYSLMDTDGAGANGGNVENLQLTGTSNINATGNALNNLLIANSGNNVLNGGAGIDTASYQYATAAVTVNLAIATAQATGGSGSDTLLNIENLTGSNFNDTLTGNTGANVLNGGAGNDTMAGGLGNDTYVVNALTDVVTELAGQGTDLIQSSISYSLVDTDGAGTNGGNVENLQLTGTGSINATGNALNNTLYANSGNNVLNGGGGNDNLNGGDGNDALIGSIGNDVLTGGLGADSFYFNTALNAATNRDTITDFVSGTDKIYLDDAIFTAIGTLGNFAAGDVRFYSAAGATAGLDVDDRVIYNTTTGALYYDADGNGAGTAVQVALLGTATHPALAAGDFVVV